MNSIGIWAYEVARRIARQHEVFVYTRGGLSTKRQIGHNVHTRYVQSEHKPGKWSSRLSELVEGRATPTRPFFASPLYYLGYSLQAALDIKRQKADIVHIQNYSQFVPIIRRFNPRAKIALHMRCEWLTQLDRSMIARRLEQTDLIFGVSDYITDLIRARFPEHSHKCATVANGVDVENFHAPDMRPGGPPLILMLGRVSPEKGTHVLLKAFQQIAPRFPEARVEIVGPIMTAGKEYIVGLSEDRHVSALDVYYNGRYIDHLHALIPDELKDRVTFKGAVNYYTTIDYYQRAAMLVNPSLSESFGRSLIEANACETPVIAARAGGMTEIIEPGVNGLLVEPDNADELAAAVSRLLEDQPLRRQLGIHGRKRVLERYTWDAVTDGLLRAYQLDQVSRPTESPDLIPTSA